MKSSTYADSSFIVSLICKDANSVAAVDYMKHVKEPLLFTPLHRVEVRNALRNAAARKDITASELRLAFQGLDEGLREGFFLHILPDWTDLFRRADELSEKHAAKDGQRTIDLLHIAIALEARARFFLSFDNRQRKLVQSIGLKLGP